VLARPKQTRLVGLFVPVLVALTVIVAGCGGSSKAGAGTTAARGKKRHFQAKVTKAEGAIGNVVPGPPPPADVSPDPDTENMGGSDANTTITPIGNDRYQLVIQNTSRIGYIDSVDWQPPPGATVESVTGSSVGACTASNGEIVCNGLNLKPPKCLCEVGGSATVTFTMHLAVGDSPGKTTGLQDSGLEITSMTPILANIPSSIGSAASGNT
jgi:hypothetical protein